MFDIFTEYPSSSVVLGSIPQWDYVRRNVVNNVRAYVDYYQNSSVYSSYQNVLVDLVYGLGVNTDMPADQYVQLIRPKALTLAASVGLISPISRSRPMKPFFYGRRFEETDELVIATNELFDVEEAYRNWKNLRPVTVVSHGITALDMPAPFEPPTSSDLATTVIVVDVPLLALQYKAFRDEQKDMSDTAGIQSFLSRYVGTNMIYSHLEQCWINRVVAQARGMAIRDHQYSRQPFSLMNLSSQYDACLSQTVDNLKRISRPTLENFYRSIPSLFHKDALSALQLPSTVPTFNVDWAFSAARIKHIVAALMLGKEKLANASAEDMAQIVRSMRTNQMLTYAMTGLSRDGYLQLCTQVDRIMQFHGK